MNNLELFEELTDIDDDLILEAHETPRVRRFHPGSGLRRIAALAAAVMLVAGSAAAAGGDIPKGLPQIPRENVGMISIAWADSNHQVYQTTSGAIEVNDKEYYYHLYTTHSSLRGVATMQFDADETLEVVFQACIILPDGSYTYKTVSKQGTNRVTVFMTNQTEGKTGVIHAIRASFYRLTEEGERVLVDRWSNSLWQWGDSIVSQDADVADLQWPDEIEQNTDAQTVLPEDSDVVVVVTEPDG